MKKYKIETVHPSYNGGGIIAFVGKADDFWFSIANMRTYDESNPPDVMEIDVCPFDENGEIKPEIWDGDFYELHWGFANDVDDIYDFYLQVYEWVKENGDPKECERNYLDIDFEIAELKECKSWFDVYL